MAHLPTGVSVVTAPAAAGPLGATANAVTSLSLAPPLVLACLEFDSRTLGAAREAGRFGVSVLGAGQEDIARAFATKAPHAEKWGDVAWSERAGVPVVNEVPLWVACELEEGHPAGDHEILIGSVAELGGDGGDPLVFWAGRYRPL